MEFTPTHSPLVFLVFLSTGLVLFLAGVGITILLLLRRPEPARKLLLAALTWVGVYAAFLLGFSLTAREKVLAAGEQKYFCEVDCHLAYSVVDVTTTKTLGAPPNPTSAQGLFYVVAVKVWFDERTITATRGDSPLAPNSRRIRVVDDQGQMHHYFVAGQKALEGREGNLACLWTPLRPGESCTAELVFDLPADIQNPRLLITTADELTSFIIGHENSPFHKKIYFNLSPPTSGLDLRRTRPRPNVGAEPAEEEGGSLRKRREAAALLVLQAFFLPTVGGDALALSVEALSPQQAIGELLAQLHAGLIEGVDVVELPGVGGLELGQHHHLPDGILVGAGEKEAAVGATSFGQRHLGGELLRAEELPQRVPAQIASGAVAGKELGDADAIVVGLNLPEGNHFVARPFHIEL